MSAWVTYTTRALPRTLDQALPVGATVLERALVHAYDAHQVPTVIEHINDARHGYTHTDARLLDAIAYGLGVDAWQASWAEAAKRDYLTRARAIQARKGTLWAVKEVLRACGQPDAQVIERVGDRWYDTSAARDVYDDGVSFYDDGDNTGWARYSIILRTQVTDTQARWIISAVQAVAPARCWLTEILWGESEVRWDTDYCLDSDYTYDAAAN